MWRAALRLTRVAGKRLLYAAVNDEAMWAISTEVNTIAHHRQLCLLQHGQVLQDEALSDNAVAAAVKMLGVKTVSDGIILDDDDTL